MSAGKLPEQNPITDKPDQAGQPPRQAELLAAFAKQPAAWQQSVMAELTNYPREPNAAAAFLETKLAERNEATSGPPIIDQAPHPFGTMVSGLNLPKLPVLDIKPSPENHSPSAAPKSQVALIDNGGRTT